MSLRPTIYNDTRSKIAKQIEEFLNRGGVITVLPVGNPDGEQRAGDVGEPSDMDEDREAEGEDPNRDQDET